MAPAEIEVEIMKHPSVKNVCVVGVPNSDQGEAPLAWVILKEGETATGEEIQKLVQGELTYCKTGKFYDRKIPQIFG